MSKYSGLLVRINPEDVGDIPAEGMEWVSPDIIPYGTQVLTYEQAVDTYNRDIAQPIVNNLNNNVYVRCKNINLSEQTTYGNVNLYYAESSLFLSPEKWNSVTLPAQDNQFGINSGSNFSQNIPQNQIGLVEAPFNLSKLPPDRHWCFIAVVNNKNKKFQIPTEFSSNAKFAQWVKENPNVAQRNISLNSGSNSNVTQYGTISNLNSKPGQFYFILTPHNVQPGTTWGAQCSDRRLSSPYSDSGTFQHGQVCTKPITVPAHVGGGTQSMQMAFTFTAPSGQAFPKDGKVTIEYRQKPTLRQESEELFEEEQQCGVVHNYRIPVIENGTVNFIIEPSIELGAIVIVPSFID
ncbi:hypothetical protein [Burkholderia singularis]|uniref:hypothetical protein n=1 Tax=Burkholderia singularis TaxID=1503053 RepID=UPI000A8355E1|nr:hypothetical protein [Burkholderia singularis]